MSFSIQPATTAAKQHPSFYESSSLIFQKIKTIRYYPQGANNENFFSDDQILNKTSAGISVKKHLSVEFTIFVVEEIIDINLIY